MKKEQPKTRNRRYYLHRRAKALAKVVSKERTIYLPITHMGGGGK